MRGILGHFHYFIQLVGEGKGAGTKSVANQPNLQNWSFFS